ncbi:MAG: HEAT repeat domain-containing protein [Myxococcota bacterium]|nr:HEAT repeat domain-containing protein [Myxococcota bacterium]
MRLILVLALCVFTFAACSGPTDPTTAAYWLEKLEQPAERATALTELGKIGDKSVLPEVIKWFEEDGPWQPDAAYALGRLGDKTTVSILTAGIDYTVGTGTDKRTRAKNRTNLNIAKAIAELKAGDGVEALVRMLNLPDLSAKEGIIRSLGKLGDSRAAEPLIKIASTESHPFIRKTAIQALGDLGDPKAVPTLIDGLFTELPGVSFYYEARYSLLQIGNAAVPTLIETLERKNTSVEAIRLPSGTGIAPGAIEGKAGFVLGALRAVEAEKQMLKALDNYYGQYQNRAREQIFASVPGAVAELAYSLGQLGSDLSVRTLSSIASEQDANLRAAGAEALTTLGATQAAGTLVAAGKTGDFAAKRSAIEAAAMLGNAELIASLEALGQGSDDAAKAIADVVTANKPPLEAAGECKSDATCWAGKAKDANIKVRKRVAYQLGWLGSKESIAQLTTLAEDDSASVRMAAMASLSRLGGADAAALQAIYDKWNKKIEYKNSNQELKRLIARSRSAN